MPQTAPSSPSNKAPPGPLWARAVHAFYDPIFDIRSRGQFQAALNDFVTLPADERAFHQTHLLYRQVQALEGVHAVLVRVEQRLNDLTVTAEALEHLEAMKDALQDLASDRYALAREGVEGDEDEDEDEYEQEDERSGPTLVDDPDEDPDFIYDRVPDDEPPRLQRPRLVRPEPEPEPAPARLAQRDPEREALVGDLVPATEGPQRAPEGA